MYNFETSAEDGMFFTFPCKIAPFPTYDQNIFCKGDFLDSKLFLYRQKITRDMVMWPIFRFRYIPFENSESLTVDGNS